jgi:hypothetical protein
VTAASELLAARGNDLLMLLAANVARLGVAQ